MVNFLADENLDSIDTDYLFKSKWIITQKHFDNDQVDDEVLEVGQVAYSPVAKTNSNQLDEGIQGSVLKRAHL